MTKHLINLEDDRSTAIKALAEAAGWKFDNPDAFRLEIDGIELDIDYDCSTGFITNGKRRGVNFVALRFKDESNDYKIVRRSLKPKNNEIDIDKLKQKFEEVKGLLEQSKKAYKLQQASHDRYVQAQIENREIAKSIGLERLYRIDDTRIEVLFGADVKMQIDYLSPELALEVVEFVRSRLQADIKEVAS